MVVMTDETWIPDRLLGHLAVGDTTIGKTGYARLSSLRIPFPVVVTSKTAAGFPLFFKAVALFHTMTGLLQTIITVICKTV